MVMFPSYLQGIAQISANNLLAKRLAGMRLRMQDANQWKRQIARLGSANEAEYLEAAEWLRMRGEASLPRLHRALRRSPGVACGAAGVLYQLGQLEGVRHVLLRAYQDEWFTYYPARDIADYGGHVGLRVGKEPVRQTIWAALEEAGRHYEEQACLQELIVALSGLRALGHMASHDAGEHSPNPTTALWKRALHFGTMNLQQHRTWHASMPLLKNMLGWIRAEAIRRLLREHEADTCLSILCGALHGEDRSVARSAVDGLQSLGDRRAVPELEAIAITRGHPLALQARRAIERLAGSQAEVLTLVRASREETMPEELLRPTLPTLGSHKTNERDTLLHIFDETVLPIEARGITF